MSSKGGKTAWKKAPDDIATLSKTFGRILTFKDYDDQKKGFFKCVNMFFTDHINWLKLINVVKYNDILIIQHPYEGLRVGQRYIKILKMRNVKIIVVIHDLLSVRLPTLSATRDKRKAHDVREKKLFQIADYIICHNYRMKDFLINKGIEQSKIIELKIFDYLHTCNVGPRVFKYSIVIAGNLSNTKSGYLYNMLQRQNRGYEIHLFGNGYAEQAVSYDAIYHGSFSPDVLPGKIEGGFGLVWDGKSIETCEGNTGEYLKINDPHKASLYLSSGIPIIVWKESAIASFVDENGLGFTINKIDDIEEIFKNFQEEYYSELLNNVSKIKELLTHGDYYMRAIQKTGYIK
ncbi:MAG: hypothetical protein E7232_08710 [Lachnospiraceae bacterium]|nr:hypothetical protein [Lachnospiraceae bacterium]